VPNKVFPLLEGTPFQLVFTPNSDTPHSGLPLDLSNGPMVVELPPGPLMGAANDLNQRWVMDLGLPGHDAGKGGKHLLLPPGHKDNVPDGWGIIKGRPFTPDARMSGILERAAADANAQMRVQSFADRRADRAAWPDRQWEWASLRPENGTFDAPTYLDLTAREKWFFQAQVESPAMFRRTAGAGSLYWLGTRDATGAFLDGGTAYRLTVPHPVPGKLFWSVTVYDTETRSEIDSGQGHAALRSLFELKDAPAGKDVVLRFGPTEPATEPSQWIKTIPGKGWFVYFRIYGPEAPAFDGSWKPGDFEKVK
jgi:hypothetical protein